MPTTPRSVNVAINPAPIRTPIDVRDGATYFKDNQSWEKYFELLYGAIFELINRWAVYDLFVDRDIDDTLGFSKMFCANTITLTLPDATTRRGMMFYFFNNDTGVITIAGTINGNPAGYQLTNPYQYVEIISDGANWLITSAN